MLTPLYTWVNPDQVAIFININLAWWCYSFISRGVCLSKPKYGDVHTFVKDHPNHPYAFVWRLNRITPSNATLLHTPDITHQASNMIISGHKWSEVDASIAFKVSTGDRPIQGHPRNKTDCLVGLFTTRLHGRKDYSCLRSLHYSNYNKIQKVDTSNIGAVL